MDITKSKATRTITVAGIDIDQSGYDILINGQKVLSVFPAKQKHLSALFGLLSSVTDGMINVSERDLQRMATVLECDVSLLEELPAEVFSVILPTIIEVNSDFFKRLQKESDNIAKILNQ